MDKSEKILFYGGTAVIALILWNKYGKNIIAPAPAQTTPTPGTTTPVPHTPVQTLPGTVLTDPDTPTHVVTPTVVTPLTTTTQLPQSPITQHTNVVKYSSCYLDMVSNCLFDNNDNLIGDGVYSYDPAKNVVQYANGYKLNLNAGTVTTDKAQPITQILNPLNISLLPIGLLSNKSYFDLPKKIVGYSSLHNIFFYNENDVTPYTILDSSFYYYQDSVIPDMSQTQKTDANGDYYTNGKI